MQRWPSANQEEASRETKLAYALISDFSLLEPCENKILSLKPSRLWILLRQPLQKNTSDYTIETVLYNYIRYPVYPSEFQGN